jgi:hypothetical protein
MVELLKSALKAQTVIAVLALVLATLMLWMKLVSPTEWRDVVNAVLLYFVGGGLLKDGLTAVANNRSST